MKVIVILKHTPNSYDGIDTTVVEVLFTDNYDIANARVKELDAENKNGYGYYDCSNPVELIDFDPKIISA